MPELHLKQPGFTCSACGPFTKHRVRIRKFRETFNSKHFYRNELDKTCFAHDAAYSDSKDLPKRTISNKILKDRMYKIATNRGDYGDQRALTSMVYKRVWSIMVFLIKKIGSGESVNKQVAE